MALFLSVCIALLCGLRTFTPLAALGWGFHMMLVPVTDWPLILASPVLLTILTCLAIAEWFIDAHFIAPKLRPRILLFGLRVICGTIAGAAVANTADLGITGTAASFCGSIMGAILSPVVRQRLALALGRDSWGAIAENSAVVVGTIFVIAALS